MSNYRGVLFKQVNWAVSEFFKMEKKLKKLRPPNTVMRDAWQATRNALLILCTVIFSKINLRPPCSQSATLGDVNFILNEFPAGLLSIQFKKDLKICFPLMLSNGRPVHVQISRLLLVLNNIFRITLRVISLSYSSRNELRLLTGPETMGNLLIL